jgi:hypothetical protein
MSAHASVALDHHLAGCGGAVTGTVRWQDNDRRQRVAVVLRYRTEGRGDVDTGVVAAVELGEAESGESRFRLDVPPLGPVTYNGQLLRLLWVVAVQVPANRSFRGSAAEADLTVVPRGWLR